MGAGPAAFPEFERCNPTGFPMGGQIIPRVCSAPELRRRCRRMVTPAGPGSRVAAGWSPGCRRESGVRVRPRAPAGGGRLRPEGPPAGVSPRGCFIRWRRGQRAIRRGGSCGVNPSGCRRQPAPARRRRWSKRVPAPMRIREGLRPVIGGAVSTACGRCVAGRQPEAKSATPTPVLPQRAPNEIELPPTDCAPFRSTPHTALRETTRQQWRHRAACASIRGGHRRLPAVPPPGGGKAGRHFADLGVARPVRCTVAYPNCGYAAMRRECLPWAISSCRCPHGIRAVVRTVELSVFLYRGCGGSEYRERRDVRLARELAELTGDTPDRREREYRLAARAPGAGAADSASPCPGQGTARDRAALRQPSATRALRSPVWGSAP